MSSILKLIKKKTESFRVKLFLTLSLTILIIITIFILFNNIVLESYLIFAQENVLIELFDELDSYFDNPDKNQYILDELEKANEKENIDIVAIGENDEVEYTTNEKFANFFREHSDLSQIDVYEPLVQTNRYKIIKSTDTRTESAYLILIGNLKNGSKIYIRAPINAIQENVEIVNKFLYIIAVITILISIVIIVFISNVISKPIIELRLITKRMKDLDFSQRFKESDSKDEIALLGHNINIMADSLELAISELKAKNSDLIKDIEEKTKIDEMRTTFISDVSHELKTPIAIIQGYAEGILNGIATDEEARNYYTEVILDEANKMNKLVKSLLELMKLEYGKREFQNKKFDLITLETEVLKNSAQLFENRGMKVIFDYKQQPIFVYADDFFIEQVFSNYITNALKYAKPHDGKLFVKIKNKIIDHGKKVRVIVENTGEGLDNEELQKIWIRFYKGDKSRHRSANSSRIGLSLVKAIMNNYKNDYGAKNTKNGIEFYFDLDIYQNKNKERIESLDAPVENLVAGENQNPISNLTSEDLDVSNKLIEDITKQKQTDLIPIPDQKSNIIVPEKSELEERKKELKVKFDNKINEEPFDEQEYLKVIRTWKDKNENKE